MMGARISTGYEEPSTLLPGESMRLWAAGFEASAGFEWSTGDERIATVAAEDGSAARLTGLSPGSVEVVVRSGAGSPIARTFHVVDPAHVAEIRIELAKEGHARDEFRLRATVHYPHGHRRDVTDDPALAWSSFDAAVADFDAAPGERGVLRARGEGSVRVAASLGRHAGSRDFFVTGGVLVDLYAVQSFDRTLVLHQRYPLYIGYSASSSAWRPADCPSLTVEHTPAGAVEIERQDSGLWIIGRRAGPVHLAARLGRVCVDRTVQVVDEPVRLLHVQVENDRGTYGGATHLYVGDRRAVRATLAFGERGQLDTGPNVTWTSSNPAVLRVDQDEHGGAAVAALAEGEATLRVASRAGNAAAELAIRVIEEPEIQWF